jgi:RimJ/RimL family protein N-acetyltransferase
MIVSLRHGTQVRIRPVRPGDKPRLQRGLRRLSPETVRRRFLAAKPAFSDRELRYLTEVDGVTHLALVAVLADDPEQVVGVARCVRPDAESDTAEFAIVVGDALQGEGLGSVLAAALADAACRVGIRRFSATTLADNEAVERLLEALATRLEHNVLSGGVRELTAELPDCAPAARAA